MPDNPYQNSYKNLMFSEDRSGSDKKKSLISTARIKRYVRSKIFFECAFLFRADVRWGHWGAWGIMSCGEDELTSGRPKKRVGDTQTLIATNWDRDYFSILLISFIYIVNSVD